MIGPQSTIAEIGARLIEDVAFAVIEEFFDYRSEIRPIQESIKTIIELVVAQI